MPFQKQVTEAAPNAAHKALAELEKKFDVQIITQNIDDLHERAGSKNVLHLHGEILKSRSTADQSLIYSIKGSQLDEGDLCEKGSQLRPHIVWFGEMVPALDEAAELVGEADIFIVVGTSLAVYPAAGLIHYAPKQSSKYYVDPAGNDLTGFNLIREKAGKGITQLVNQLMNN